MSTFHLRVKFTGICTFVPNSGDGPVRVCVLLPDGRSNKEVLDYRALDGAALRRHLGFILFRLYDLKGAKWAHQDAQVIWYLSGQRLTLSWDGGANDFTDDLQYIAKLEEIVPEYASVAPIHLSGNPNCETADEPDAQKILAQFLIDSGILTTGGEDSTVSWVFPATVSGEPVEANLTHEVFLELRGLTRASITATNFEGSTSKVWHFEGAEDQWIEITVANLCDDNPLRWHTENDRLPPDEDFRWHYQLLERKEDLRDALFSLDLPIPYMAKIEGNGQGRNCPPSLAAPSDLGHLRIEE